MLLFHLDQHTIAPVDFVINDLHFECQMRAWQRPYLYAILLILPQGHRQNCLRRNLGVRMRCRNSPDCRFCKKDQKVWAKVGGILDHHIAPWLSLLLASRNSFYSILPKRILLDISYNF